MDQVAPPELIAAELPGFVQVPPRGAGEVSLTDARTGRRWTVPVSPFLIGRTPVCDVHGGPLVELSWRQAVLLCNAWSRRDGLSPAYRVTEVEVPEPDRRGRHDRPAPDSWQVVWDRSADGYRLPTEAEWQLACQAGTPGPHHGPLDEVAWYRNTSDGALHRAGTKSSNAWGLHDMLGNVWEWCWDLFDEELYGPYRVIRGGGWADPAWSCRAGVRRKTQPTARFDDLGVRLARSL